jgi:hypothetical protein
MTYELGTNEDWPIHTDGDLATINICLSRDFQGKKSRFCSYTNHLFVGTDLRLYPKEGGSDTFVDYNHRIGRAIIVLGDNRHSVTPLLSGKRYSLIVKLNPIGHNY